MEWLELLSILAISAIILAAIVFALIGIGKVYSDYKESKWQKEYGDKLKQDTERNRWENMELLRDRTFLLEEVIRDNCIESNIDRIDRIISEVDYDARYNTWKRNEAKWKVSALSSMAGGFGSSKKAQADLDEDFDEYEEQRRQELRMKLGPASN